MKKLDVLFSVVIVILFFTNCEKEEVFIDSNVQESSIMQSSNISYLSGSELPQVVSHLKNELSDANFYNPKSNNAISNKNASISYNKIMEVSGKENAKNYTFNLEVGDTKKNEFYNLIVHKKTNGKLKKPYVIKYTIDIDVFDTFLANNGDMSNFKGSYKYYKFDKFFNTTNLKSTNDCGGGTLPSGGSGADGNYTVGDNMIFDVGTYPSDVITNFGSTIIYGDAGSYVYTINEARTGESLSGMVSNAGISLSWLTENGIRFEYIDINNLNNLRNVNIDVNLNSQSAANSGGSCTAFVLRDNIDGGITFEARSVPCMNSPEGGGDDKNAYTNDCETPDDGEVGILPAPIFGCGLVRTYNPVNGLCYNLEDLAQNINAAVGNNLNTNQLNFLKDEDNVHETSSIDRFLRSNNTIEAQISAIQAINALMDDIPVIFNLDSDNIFTGDPINFLTATSEQKVSIVVSALKSAIEDNTIDYFDIHDLFYNLPPIDVRVVAKVFIGDKLLDVRVDFRNYDNLEVSEYPNDGKQVGPLMSGIGNYSLNGYWFLWKFRSHGATYADGADAMWLFVKEKGQYNYENSDYFSDFMGF